MSRVLIVNNIPFNYPDAGDEPGWGADATAWSQEVTTVLSNVVGPNDILETAFNIANNQASATDITGLAFNAGTVRSALVSYAVFRLSDAQPSGNAESGQITLIYDNNAGWSLVQGSIAGYAGVIFTITPAGQIQYTSSDIGTLNYVGNIKFTAKALLQ